MNALRFIGQILRSVLKTLAYGWIGDLGDLLKRSLESLKRYFRYLKKPHADQDESTRPCHTIDNPAIHRPDPCIYSQEYLMKLGLAVTWDNPDIIIRKGGVQVPEHALEPDTDYVVEATIWNNSYEAPAVGLKAVFSFLSFGVGATTTAIGQTFVNLGVKGGTNHPARAQMPWHTPAAPGHFCLQVNLHWADDVNPGNNMGQNNVDVVTPQSPALFKFTLRNDTGRAERYQFDVDTYSLPALPQCPTEPPPPESPEEHLRKVRERHDRAKFPIPAGWDVAFTPALVSLDPSQEAVIDVAITPPPGFTGQQPFNVNARHSRGYAGGVTLTVSAP